MLGRIDPIDDEEPGNRLFVFREQDQMPVAEYNLWDAEGQPIEPNSLIVLDGPGEKVERFNSLTEAFRYFESTPEHELYPSAICLVLKVKGGKIK
jgi:hypothetical protein